MGEFTGAGTSINAMHAWIGQLLLALAPLVCSGHSPAADSDAKALRPNVVFVLSDDQDIELGSFPGPMRHTNELLAEQGAAATHWYVNTPVCCPSRAQTLSGRYAHNLREVRAGALILTVLPHTTPVHTST